ncbi:MAG: PQQ-binding-like beta-propeller repeat protein [Polyangiales bacterium]
MARLVTTTCPKCGANVPVEPGAERATCMYCQTVSVLKPAAASSEPSRGSSGGLLALLALGALLIVCGAGGAFYLLWGQSAPAYPEPPSVAVMAEPAIPEPTVAEPAEEAPVEPPPAPALRMRAEAPFFAEDLDGDGQRELIVPVTLQQAQLYAVFDARTGAERTRTPELPRAELVAVAGTTVKRLVLTTRLGQLHAYDLLSGAEQWTSALADSALSLCTTRDGELHVTTADQRQLLLDLTTGRQSETRATCSPAIARSMSGEDPRDRHDYGAPIGTEAYRCGSGRVIGSSSYTIADACRGKIPSSLDGMVAHRIWKHGAGWLVFGVRAPGRYVPRMAYLERGRVTWAQDVPAANPLDAEQGGPREVALVGNTLAIVYATESDRSKWLTAFDVTDGHRVFTQQLSACDGGTDLGATEDAYVLRCGETVQVLEPADGSIRATLGG